MEGRLGCLGDLAAWSAQAAAVAHWAPGELKGKHPFPRPEHPKVAAWKAEVAAKRLELAGGGDGGGAE